MASAQTSFAAEAFTLLSLGICIIILRTYARIRLVGFKNLEADDYLMLFVVVPYSIETSLAYLVGARFHGLSNSGMTDEEREALSPESDEYRWRVNGSKTQVAGWIIYVSVLWMIKASLCVFYLRLTNGLTGYKKRIHFGFVLIVLTYLALVIAILASCSPMHRLWQIYPNPGTFCQPGLSPIYVFLVVSLNVVTDIYLLLIPVPMLWGASIPRVKKLGLIVLFSGGIFIMVAGLLRCVLILEVNIYRTICLIRQLTKEMHQDSKTGPQAAASWAVRESFVAVATSNLPLTWGWMRKKLSPYFSSLVSSDKKSRSGPQPGSIPLQDHNPGSFRWRSRQGATVSTVTGNRASDPEGSDIFMHAGEAGSDEVILSEHGGIKKEVEFSVSTYQGSARDA